MSLGHTTEQEANLAWDGSNPGGGMIYSEPCEETDRFDRMGQACKQEMDELNRKIAQHRPLHPWR